MMRPYHRLMLDFWRHRDELRLNRYFGNVISDERSALLADRYRRRIRAHLGRG